MIRTALALGIVLELIKILRRAPTWLLILVGLAVSYLHVLLVDRWRPGRGCAFPVGGA